MIQIPKVNEMQAYRDYNLAFKSPGSGEDDAVDADKDPITYRPSWNSSTTDSWLRSLFPHALTWLDENRPLADPDTYYWVLLVPSTRSKLTEFVKKGEITGDDLEKCRTPKKGKAWRDSKIYFGDVHVIFDVYLYSCEFSCVALHHSIPPNIWRHGRWDADDNDDDKSESNADKNLPVRTRNQRKKGAGVIPDAGTSSEIQKAHSAGRDIGLDNEVESANCADLVQKAAHVEQCMFKLAFGAELLN